MSGLSPGMREVRIAMRFCHKRHISHKRGARSAVAVVCFLRLLLVADQCSDVMYAEGVRSHSPGSRVGERTLGNWRPKRIDPERVASPAESNLYETPSGYGFITDRHPGCARRLATLGFAMLRLRRKDHTVLKPLLRNLDFVDEFPDTLRTMPGRTAPRTNGSRRVLRISLHTRCTAASRGSASSGR